MECAIDQDNDGDGHCGDSFALNASGLDGCRQMGILSVFVENHQYE
jgi:hypothetical protein